MVFQQVQDQLHCISRLSEHLFFHVTNSGSKFKGVAAMRAYLLVQSWNRHSFRHIPQLPSLNGNSKTSSKQQVALLQRIK
jgi:hypothetical protein